MILYKSFHNINVADGTLSRKNMPEDFDGFVNDYIAFAIRNGNNKEYSITDYNLTVAHCVFSIASIATSAKQLSQEKIDELDGLSDSIANKLLIAEQQAQQRITAMGKQIKLGSLIQALITMDGEYKFIVAKVEHSEWYDGESLRKNLGFPSEKKNVWKSAVFPMIVDEDITFDSVRVYTDNDAKYWAQHFLELSEKRNDSTNTKTVCDAVELLLKRHVRSQSDQDYYILKNSLIQTLKTPQLVNYYDMIEKLVGKYQPAKEDLNMDGLKKALQDLPGKGTFDCQFMTVPGAVSKHRRIKFPITNAIELSIEEGVSNYYDSVTAVELTGGKKCLQIECHNDRTYNMFVKNNAPVEAEYALV